MHKTQAFQPIRALQSAWEILMKAPLPMWVGGLILVVVESLGSGGGGGNFQPNNIEDVEHILWILVPIMGIGMLFAIAVVAVTSWLKTGYYLGIEGVMKNGDHEFEQLFKTHGRWLSVFLVHLFQLFLFLVTAVPFLLLIAMAVAIGSSLDLREGEIAATVGLVCLFYLPVFFYLGLGYSLMTYAACLDGTGPVDSLQRSWSLASGIRIQLFLMVLLHVAITILGLCACLVGVIPASIIGHVMWTEAYVQATREDLNGWWINNQRVGGPGPDAAPGGAGPGATEGAPREVPARPVVQTPTPEPRQPSPAPEEGPPSDGNFDPSAWRKDSDIPPIEDEPS